ncbi:hypothetical protein Sango_2739000 [Sesamum angolense]|uniref:Uncharacterized protein n=1 Tax=Sesamum angolense TaxID=2727404 RepID=A0AAE1VZ24_9LAMI|nr:hypothetical protein Sango_2739000 [Sesamum angolense]
MKRRRGKGVEIKIWRRSNAITVKRWVTLLVNALSQRRYRRNKTYDKGSSRIRKLPLNASMQPLHRYGIAHKRRSLGLVHTNSSSALGQERITRLARKGLLGPLAKVNLPTCEPCMAGKAFRKPFGKAKRATHPLKLVHSDICGQMNGRARHDFLEEYFPSISEVKRNLKLYELQDPQGGASITIDGESPHSYPVIDGDNESDPRLSGSCSLEEHNFQNPQTRISKCGGIPRRRYEIEGKSFMCASVDIDEPATYEEAVTSLNANEWITAMKEEMSSMAKNSVWELVDLPTGCKTIGNKWFLKVDNILLAGNNMEMIVVTQKWLSSTFEMKDKGEAEYILGVKIHRDRSKKLVSLS